MGGSELPGPENSGKAEAHVAIMAHNEEGNIPELLDKFDIMFRESGLKGEVIVIDEG